jgi:hypothetical protein
LFANQTIHLFVLKLSRSGPADADL